MPELPEVTAYVEALERHVVGQSLDRIRLVSPFVLRSFDPPLSSAEGRRLTGIRRLGKRIVLALEGDLFLVFHLMITGRLRWKESGVKVPRKYGLAAFDFSRGSLLFTEAASKKRASLHLVDGETALAEHDPGGLEVLETDLETFREVLSRENHTLKRSLTDPGLLAGIGNAFSDEILHRARLSPFKQTSQLGDDEWPRLFEASRETLRHWIEAVRREVGDGFPDKLSAVKEGMAVHGRYNQPCPACGKAVQRLIYAESEANYCPTCQTAGKLLADRVLSRLLKKDWPRTLEELEARKSARRDQ